jgi:cation diffusion facilitator CzcD-associated flavoprotein CzcO
VTSNTLPARQAAVVIGAGFAGINVAVRLAKAGVEDFVVLDQGSALGGTWWHNRYPGAAVDTPSMLYSYSFKPSIWTRTHVEQSELQTYFEHTVDSYGLRSHFRFDTRVASVVWEASQHAYRVSTGAGQTILAETVISAVGFLSDPRYPDWPGLDTFRGPKFHTARWESEHDLTARRVAVVGSGSSAAQVVPALAGKVGKVVMFQREPGWVLPKNNRAFRARESLAMRSPLVQRTVRLWLLLERQRVQNGAKIFREGTPENKRAETAALKYIDTVFADRPDLRAAVTPSYAYAGKRPVLSDNLYQSLLRDDVELVPYAVTKVTPDGVIDSTGAEHKVDVLVMATGFKPSEYLSTLKVTGRSGLDLHSYWNNEPHAFLGMLVPNFPNFFIMYGPNTNGGNIATHLESQASYIAAAVKYAVDRHAAIEVREWANSTYNRLLQQRLEGTVWATFANNYYKSASGRVVTEFSDGAIPYAILTKVLRRTVWVVDRKESPNERSMPGLARWRRFAESVRLLHSATTGGILKPGAPAPAPDAE